jgi:hypothetical protein
MAHLSAVQIAEHAYKAGFRGSALTTATAVAMAESNGDPNAHNGVPPDNSYGLWQVNMLGALGPARRQEFGLKSDSQLFNPDTNAKAAWEISDHGHDFGPWSTYTSGAYRDHLTAARHAEQVATKNHGSTAPATHGDNGSGKSGGKGDGKGDGKAGAKGSGKDGGTTAGKSGGKGGSGHIAVEPEQLHSYANQAGKIGQGLTRVSATVDQAGGTIKADTLGGVAGDGGFTTALRDFVDVYGDRIKQAGTAADQLGRSVSNTGTNYQSTEDHNQADFTALQS